MGSLKLVFLVATESLVCQSGKITWKLTFNLVQKQTKTQRPLVFHPLYFLVHGYCFVFFNPLIVLKSQIPGFNLQISLSHSHICQHPLCEPLTPLTAACGFLHHELDGKVMGGNRKGSTSCCPWSVATGHPYSAARWGGIKGADSWELGTKHFGVAIF